jgi:hypothetical protein
MCSRIQMLSASLITMQLELVGSNLINAMEPALSSSSPTLYFSYILLSFELIHNINFFCTSD